MKFTNTIIFLLLYSTLSLKFNNREFLGFSNDTDILNNKNTTELNQTLKNVNLFKADYNA
jgi:hypothetical protein